MDMQIVHFALVYAMLTALKIMVFVLLVIKWKLLSYPYINGKNRAYPEQMEQARFFSLIVI